MNDESELSCFKSSSQLMAGVLVAISIPIFTSQLEKSRDAVTLSNIRVAYAQAQTAYLTGSNDGDDVVYTGKTATTDATVVVKNVEAKGQSGSIDNFDQLPFADKAAGLKDATNMGGTPGTYELTFTYDANGIKSVTASK